MNKRKSLKELNLLDKFLFDEAMDDPENVKTMLDIILNKKTNLKHPPQTEKEQRTSTDNRQIRLDVYAMDEDDVIYEVEAQKENTHNLPKRSRLYQRIIDSKLLLPGVVDFNYMEHSTEEVSEQCKSERIQKMHRRVCRIKASEKTEVKYMQAWEEKLLERQKEKRELLRKMNHKMSIEEIADVLDMDVSEVKHIIEEQDDTEDLIGK